MNFQELFSPARIAVIYCLIRTFAVRVMILAGLQLTSVAAETATVAPGARVRFQASAEGTPAPVFQWRKNGAAIAGVTGALFTIESATASDAASYRVTATNVAGSADSPEIVLEVGFGGPAPNTPPAFTLHPIAPTSAIAGGTVSFSVAASGSPTPTFQWLKNGAAILGATQATLTLAGLSTSDSATYAAVATNVVGAAMSDSVTLNVTMPPTPPPPTPPPPPPPADSAPVFTTQPAASLNVIAGNTVTLFVGASGKPTPTFQWEKNGVPIDGATNAVLILADVTPNDAGSYSAAAVNSVGSARSNLAVLVVTPPPPQPPADSAPVFTTQPAANLNVIAGNAVTLFVAASGKPAPTFQWEKSGVPIDGATNSTLILADVTTSSSGSYVAVAVNAVGSSRSNPAALVVTPVTPPPPADSAPVITTQPTASLSVAAGNTVTLFVGASGKPAPTFQWEKTGIPINGATNATLTLAGVTASDSGSYVAVAVNSIGSTRSNPAVLAVIPPPPQPPAPPPTPTPPPPPGPGLAPTITSQPTMTQTVIAGTSVQLTAAATGSPAPSFQWRKNGIGIAGATNATLAFASVTTGDAATYTVLASNPSGTAVSQNAILLVNSRPVFSTQPAPQAAAFGARAVFSAVVTAIPGANLQWRKDGVAIPGATRSVLTIDFVSNSDLGVYSVIATNALGSATSADAALLRAAPPVFTTQPASQTVAARSNVTFAAAASGGPSPTFQWKKDGINIPGATAATLYLAGVEKTHEGFYSVEASNSMGWVVSTRAALIVNGTSNQGQPSGAPPISPTGSTTVGSRIVNLSVRAQAGGENNLIVGFVINGSATKPMLIRGIGPTLGLFGLSDSLADPTLSLYSGASLSASNDDWRTNNNALQIIEASARLGAFSLPESAADSALLTTLAAGAYTIQINGKDSASGVALVEVYDAAPENAASLVNLSVRTHVGTGADAPNLGFVITGDRAKRLMIRAVGPTLAAFGVPNVISDPQLELYRDGIRIDQNDNWGGSVALSSTFERIGAFGLAEPGSRDAALLVSLEPGAYTVIVSGVEGSTGVALVEIYEVP